METKETITQLENDTAGKSQPDDVKNLWERWDKAQKEDVVLQSQAIHDGL